MFGALLFEGKQQVSPNYRDLDLVGLVGNFLLVEQLLLLVVEQLLIPNPSPNHVSRQTLGVRGQQSCGSRLPLSYSFCGRGLRVLTLSDPGRLSARAALFPKGEREHALRPHFAVQHLVSGGVGSRVLALATQRGKHADHGTLSFGVSGVPHTEWTDSRCHLNQTAPGRIPHLPAYASRGLDLNGCE